MTALLLRTEILLAVILAVAVLVIGGRIVVERRRLQALQAQPLAVATLLATTETSSSAVRVLFFSGEHCQQCHTMQAPALRRVIETADIDIAVTEIDAETSPELARRYHVLTLPTTVVLDANGNAQAVNYGFAHAQKLLQQIHAVAVAVA